MSGYHWVLGQSASMHAVLDQVTAVASSPMTVLLLGESGTGKEVVARASSFESTGGLPVCFHKLHRVDTRAVGK